jgi:3-phenylpropionate/trans-cinnamate dioxygenase ferredoxin reductase subunit
LKLVLTSFVLLQTGSNIELDSRGNVVVDQFLQTNVTGVFAAGDIANFPLSLPNLESDTRATIGHWQLALAHGKCVGQNVAAKEMSTIKTVPFFWTVQVASSGARFSNIKMLLS